MTALVISVGQPDRGDDAAGLAVAAALRRLAPHLTVIDVAAPTRLVDTWQDAEDVVVVDAMMSGRSVGEVTVIEVGPRPLAARPGAGGSHGFGVAEAIELARSLGRLPHRLVVVGIEAGTFAYGDGLSPAVAAAVDAAAQAVLTALSGPPRGDGDR